MCVYPSCPCDWQLAPSCRPAHLSRDLGIAGCGSRCPSPRPRYSSTPARSHSGPECCHTRLGLLCRSNTRGARCSRLPACGCWAAGAGLVGAAWPAGWDSQVPGAARLGMNLGRQGASVWASRPCCHRWGRRLGRHWLTPFLPATHHSLSVISPHHLGSAPHHHMHTLSLQARSG